MKAILVLENGTVFNGESFGAPGEKIGEVVFNTSMTGYQEIITDPSYKSQIVCMTDPLIGNCGVNPEDVESRKIWLEGFVVKECSKIVSNWRAKASLREYLRENNIVGIEGIDTRFLTKQIREEGTMKGIISTQDFSFNSLLEKVKKAPGLVGRDLVKEITIDKPYSFNKNNKKNKYKVVVIDCGVKYNILRILDSLNCEVIVVPGFSSTQEILSYLPSGILLSNGPGDPAPVNYLIETTRNLLKEKIPIFGICLGHQILCLALGGKTYKMKFGHHGANHPVKNLETKKIDITVQNHGFCVDKDSLPKEVKVTHLNLNDGTVEGIEHQNGPFFSVQFHPESSPGPQDAGYIFNRFNKFLALMEKYGKHRNS